MPCEHVWGMKDAKEAEHMFLFQFEDKTKESGMFSYCPCCGEPLRPDLMAKKAIEESNESTD